MGLGASTTVNVTTPYLVALDTESGIMRRYGRGAGNRAVETGAVQCQHYPGTWDASTLAEALKNFRVHGSDYFG